MRTTQALTITLPHDMLEMVKAKVTSGEYATESEVIRDGLIEELDDESEVAIVGGANLNPTTELGKTLLSGLEALLKRAETALEDEI